MKVVLINPPQTLPTKAIGVLEARIHPPLSLLYLAAVMGKRGIEVEIVDSLVLGKEILHYEGDSLHLGAPWQVLRQKVSELKPELVGITNPFTSQFKNAIVAADLVKEIDPHIPVIVGGPHASVSPKDFLSRTNVDVLVMGEGELILPEVVNHFAEGGKDLREIRGIAFRDRHGRDIVVNQRDAPVEKLDELPVPAYHLLNLEDYFLAHKKGLKGRPYASVGQSMPVITSRGCPYNCCFCSVHLHMGRRWRAHSAKYVLEHLKILKERYGIRHIDFEDDALNLDKKRFAELLEGMIREKLDLTWCTPNGVRADLLDEALISRMKESGCIRVTIAPESGDQETLDKIIDKRLDLRTVVSTAELTKKYKIATHAFFVVGFPGETRSKIQKTFDFAATLLKKYDVVPSISVANPLVGTRLYLDCKREGYLVKDPSPEDILLGSHPGALGLIKTREFSPESLRTGIRRFYKRVFMISLWKAPTLIARDPKAALEKAKGLISLAFK